jgi:hypothetical protein
MNNRVVRDWNTSRARPSQPPLCWSWSKSRRKGKEKCFVNFRVFDISVGYH